MPSVQMYPDCKVHGASVGPTWDRQDPGEPHVGHMNFAIWVAVSYICQHLASLKALGSKQNGRHFADDISNAIP